MSINVAVLGIGNHARRNTLPALAKCEPVNLAGISTRNVNTGQQVAHQYHCRYYESENEMLTDPDIDVIYIALPVGLHAEWGMQTIQAGKHLWCEKSLTHDPALTLQLISEAKKHELCVCECFMYTHHPQFRRLEQIMQGDKIGDIRSILARFSFPHLPADNIRYSNELGGGALLDAGCYPLHALRQLAGSIPEHVYSLLYREKNYAVDTSGSALLGFESGLQACAQWGFGAAYANEIELVGIKGRVKAVMVFSRPESRKSQLEITTPDGGIETEDFLYDNHFKNMFEDFSKALSDRTARQFFWEDAMQQSAVLEQVLHNN